MCPSRGALTLIEAQFASELQQCIRARDLSQGRKIHQLITQQWLECPRELGNLLITMYGKCGSIEDAQRAFDRIQGANVFTWNLMTTALVENGKLKEAGELFHRQPGKSITSFNIMIAAYAHNGHTVEAKIVFDQMLERDICSWNSMINAYIQNDQLSLAKALFNRMQERDVISWNSMVAGFAKSSRGREALQLFRMMELEGLKPDRVTIMCVLHACATDRLRNEAKQVHWRASKYLGEIKVGNAVVNMFGKCGFIVEAKRAFDRLPERDVISWTTLFTAYAANGDMRSARTLFDKMPHRTVVSWNCMLLAYSNAGEAGQMMEIFELMILDPGVKPDESSLVTVLDCCANQEALDLGVRAHEIAEGTGLLCNVIVGNALLSLYCKCREMGLAQELFDAKLRIKNVISWTTMISGYAQAGEGKLAVKVFRRMDLEGVEANEVTFISVLDACACSGDLVEGRHLHRRSIETGLFSDSKVGNSVLNLYGKCGKVEDSWEVFQSMRFRNRISWNAMIAAFAQFGHCDEGLNLFRLMLQEGFATDSITFTSVLSICAHSGLRLEFREQFVALRSDHGIAYDVSHFVCVVDLLGRLGHLSEAKELVTCMPLEPSASIWTTLLSGCRIHKNLERAAHAAEQAIALDPEDPGLYSLLANLYFEAGKIEFRNDEEMVDILSLPKDNV